MDITIRLANAADFAAVYDFVNRLEGEVMDQSSQQLLYLKNVMHPEVIYLLAAADGRSVGFLSCHIQDLLHHGGKIGEIQEMYVDADFRGLGVGQQLVKKIKQIAKSRGVLQLEVTSRLSRTDAHRFYEREGFDFSHKKFLYKLL